MSTQLTEARFETIINECIAVRVRMLNRVVTKIFDDALRPLGVKVSQLNILVAAWKLDVANPQQVCDILHLDPSTLSRNVDRMRVSGWLEVVPGEDARQQPFRITAQGRTLLSKAVPAWEKAQARAAKLLGKEGIGSLKRTVKSLGLRG